MSRGTLDRLRALASCLEDDLAPHRTEQLAHRAVERAEREPVGRLRSFAQRLEAGTRGVVAERIAARAVLSQRPTRLVLRRAGAIAAAAMTIAAGAVGVGAIANQASPGDLLYGIDRAYETVGSVLGSHPNHAQERLSEALRLLDQGRSTEAVALVDEAVKDYTAQHGLTSLEKEYAAARAQVSVSSTTTTTEPVPTTATTPKATTPTTAIQTTTTEDPVTALRLAVEMLLRDVKQTDIPSDAVAQSALQAAAAATAVEVQGPVIAAGSTTTTEGTTAGSSSTTTPNTITLPTDTTEPSAGSTTTTSGDTSLTIPTSTTTTTPGDTTSTTEPGATTTTTRPGDTTTSTTTTTTQPGGGGIILPPLP